MDMCPKDLVCDRKTWYVPETPAMFLKILAYMLKNAVMCTQLMTDTLLKIITRFLCLRIIFMDDVSGVPRMWICAPKDLVCDRKTWYVPERPGMFSKILACVRKRCHVHIIDD